MMREALARLDRKANKHSETFGTAKQSLGGFWNSFGAKTAVEAALENLEPSEDKGLVVGGRGLEPRTFCL
jgi:hypothetical protein